MDEAALDFLLVTRSKDGISYFKRDGSELFHEQFPVEVQEVTDVTGAGDTVVAVTAFGLARGWDYSKLCLWCNFGGWLCCGAFWGHHDQYGET